MGREEDGEGLGDDGSSERCILPDGRETVVGVGEGSTGSAEGRDAGGITKTVVHEIRSEERGLEIGVGEEKGKRVRVSESFSKSP